MLDLQFGQAASRGTAVPIDGRAGQPSGLPTHRVYKKNVMGDGIMNVALRKEA